MELSIYVLHIVIPEQPNRTRAEPNNLPTYSGSARLRKALFGSARFRRAFGSFIKIPIRVRFGAMFGLAIRYSFGPFAILHGSNCFC